MLQLLASFWIGLHFFLMRIAMWAIVPIIIAAIVCHVMTSSGPIYVDREKTMGFGESVIALVVFILAYMIYNQEFTLDIAIGSTSVYIPMYIMMKFVGYCFSHIARFLKNNKAKREKSRNRPSPIVIIE